MICWGASLSAVIRGVTTGVKGHNSTGAESLWRRRKVPTMSHVFQCSTFASERPQVRTWGRQTWSRQTCFLPWAPSNLVTPLTVIQYYFALSMYMKWGVSQLHSYAGHNSLSKSSTFNALLWHSGKLFANVYVCSFLRAALWFNQQGRNEGARMRNYPGAKSLLGALKYCGGAEWLRGRQIVPTMSHVHSAIQYICFRKTSGSKMGEPNLLLAPGAI